MSTQPEALRQAELLESIGILEPADELRCLHAENVLLHYTLTAYVGVSEALAVEQTKNEQLEAQRDELLEALQACDEAMGYMSEYDIPLTLPAQVKAAIAKAGGAA